MYYIEYGGDEYEYRFWDYEGNKMILNWNIVFNKFILYKNKSNTSVKDTSIIEHNELKEVSVP